MHPTTLPDRRIERPRFPLAALGLVAVLALAACGGAAGTAEPSDTAPMSDATMTEEPTAPPATEAPDPAALSTDLVACDVITADDVKAVLGIDAEATPKGVQADGITYCRYDAAGLNITLDARTGAARYNAAEKSYKEISPVGGVGEAAFFSAAEKALVVRSGETALWIYLRTGEDRVTLSTELAKVAVGRL